MGRKTIIGMSIEGQHIIVSRVEKQRKKYIVREFEKVDISELIAVADRVEEELEPVAADDIFGVGDDDTELMPMDTTEDASDEMADFKLDEDWLTTPEDSARQDVMSKVVFELHMVLKRMSSKRVDIGLCIPTGNTMYHTLVKPSDVKSRKKIDGFVQTRVGSIYGSDDISVDNFKWDQLDDKSLLVASTLETPILLELLERLNAIHPHRFFIRTLLPEEVALMRYIEHTQAETDGSTVTIALVQEGARIVISRHDRIQSAMPIIPMKRAGLGFINKVFSRIMMELEKGQVNYVNQFVVYDRVGNGEDLVDMLNKNFDGIDCQLLTAGDNVQIMLPKVTEDEEETGKKGVKEPGSPCLTAIAAAMSASGDTTKIDETLNFVPGKVLDRQKVFKLKWHGVVLLFLIAIVPILTNNIYQSIRGESVMLGMQIDRNNASMQDLRVLQQEVLNMDQINNILQVQLQKIEELSEGAYMWSETLNHLSAGLGNIPNTWITSLQYTDGNTIVLDGYTLYRDRIPMLADLFAEAGIQRVTRSEIRNRELFQFTIIVSRIVEDESIFDPKVIFEEGTEL